MTHAPRTDSELQTLIQTWIAAYNAVEWLILRSRLSLALTTLRDSRQPITIQLPREQARLLLEFADLDLQTQR